MNRRPEPTQSIRANPLTPGMQVEVIYGRLMRGECGTVTRVQHAWDGDGVDVRFDVGGFSRIVWLPDEWLARTDRLNIQREPSFPVVPA